MKLSKTDLDLVPPDTVRKLIDAEERRKEERAKWVRSAIMLPSEHAGRAVTIIAAHWTDAEIELGYRGTDGTRVLTVLLPRALDVPATEVFQYISAVKHTLAIL